MPLSWEELEAAEPMDFTINNVPARLEKNGDRWHDVLERKQSLRRLSVLTVKLGVRPNAKAGSRCTHGSTFHRISDGVVRAGRHPGEAVHRHPVGECDLVQSAAQDRRITSQAAVPMPERRRVVEREEMVKGYEFAKDQYVLFSPEEIKALEEVGTHAVEISEFVPIESITRCTSTRPTIWHRQRRAKPYALLTEALKQAGRCGVGRWPRAARAIS